MSVAPDVEERVIPNCGQRVHFEYDDYGFAITFPGSNLPMVIVDVTEERTMLLVRNDETDEDLFACELPTGGGV